MKIDKLVELHKSVHKLSTAKLSELNEANLSETGNLFLGHMYGRFMFLEKEEIVNLYRFLKDLLEEE